MMLCIGHVTVAVLIFLYSDHLVLIWKPVFFLILTYRGVRSRSNLSRTLAIAETRSDLRWISAFRGSFSSLHRGDMNTVVRERMVAGDREMSAKDLPEFGELKQEVTSILDR